MISYLTSMKQKNPVTVEYGKIAKPKVRQMCLYICIGANSQNFANTGVLVTCLWNFPQGRGIMLGLLKGFTVQIYLAVYGNDSKSLLLLIAWFPAALSVVFVYTIRSMKVVRRDNEVKFAFTHGWYVASASVVCCLLFVLLVIGIKEEYLIWIEKKLADAMPPTGVTIEKLPLEEPKSSTLPPSSSIGIEEKATTSFFANIFKKPDRGEDYGILQALFSIDMLLILIATFCGLGTNLTAVDNLGQIGKSLGYPTLTISTFVSLVSIWNFCGRVFAGFVSEILLEKFSFPRPLMIVAVLLLSCVGHLFIAFPNLGSIYVASIIVGFCYGAQLRSEIFDLKHYATLFNCGQLASPLGSYVFNVLVARRLYDKEALKQLAQKGAFITALRNGHWILLDEVNLAPPETLQRLMGVLVGENGSLCLTERGDVDYIERHPAFRLFGYMNPTTDLWKERLAVSA
ncbi:hypothetical protein IFM89_013980 [Coptis chinensis]|uniref:Uncharacterized protein n=1 Tax=Coptis chinensis TaxID=261450 RepID=A0A835M652_9MAGN|nr:hypothetical protein IFM89_013980 [Coptis chinensis]